MTMTASWQQERDQEVLSAIRQLAPGIAAQAAGFVPGADLAQAVLNKDIPGLEALTPIGFSVVISDLLGITTVQRRVPDGRRTRGYPLSILMATIDALEAER